MVEITAITPVRTFERVVEQIAQRIRLGELDVGDRIPAERDLAAAMQISRPTLREAIKVLVDLNVLEVRREGSPGIYVASTHMPRDLLLSTVEVRVDEVRSVLEARRLFEPRVAQLAAVHAQQLDFDRMQATIDAQRTMLADGIDESHSERFAVQDVYFHLRMAGATHNSTIVSMMRTLQGRLEFARDLVQHEHDVPEWVVTIHERTLSAIRQADHDLIESVMEEHIRELEVAWERTTQNSLIRTVPDFLLPPDQRSPHR